MVNNLNLPRISIVMPSFNQGQFLEEAICSILDQRYPNLEFMILDGYSTDNSREIIENYASSLAYWRSEPDRGQSDAIAQGLARAQGDLLGWVNSDDALLPDSLNAIAQAFREHPRGGLFGGNYILFDKYGRITRCKKHPSNAGWFAKHGVFAFNPPGSFFKRRDYEAVGGLRTDLHYVMDNDLFLRMIAQGTQYVHVDQYLSVFRQHEDQKPTVYRRAALSEMERWQRELLPSELSRYAVQKRWQVIFRLWQVINGNYLTMSLDTLRLRGHLWKTLVSGEI
jgi:glycosyltransferase involved in cell wall biosynthesis